MLQGCTHRLETGCGKLYITLNRDNVGDVVETFFRMGKMGSCSAVFLEGLSRLVGLALRHSIPVEEVAEELVELQCPSGAWNSGVFAKSCLDGIGRELMKSGGGVVSG